MRWYVLSKTTGIATLCASERDARSEAEAYNRLYPLHAPHVATRLQPIDTGLLAAATPLGKAGRHAPDWIPRPARQRGEQADFGKARSQCNAH